MNDPASELPPAIDVAVIGGGIAGLTAASYAARGGASVLLVEARQHGGGRARSETVSGFTVNQGAHALYRSGAFHRVLADLGVTWSGHTPRLKGSGWFRNDAWTSWLADRRPLGGPAGVRALVNAVRPATMAKYDGASMADWLADQPEAARPMLWVAVRTATYSSEMSLLDARAGLKQLALAARSVHYLDRGWQSLVHGLQNAASVAGATTTIGKVTAVASGAKGFDVVIGDRAVQAGAVVVAVGGLADADRMLAGASPLLHRWAEGASPQSAYCLDVTLDRAPEPRVAAYGLDEPIYFVDHARSARVAPPGAALFHGLFYEPDRAGDAEPRARMEATLDAWQPGWRENVVDVIERRRLVVAHDRPTPGRAVEHRPVAQIPDLEGAWFAGDAVTADGLLADASASSGRTAGLAAAAHARRGVRSPVSGGTVWE